MEEIEAEDDGEIEAEDDGEAEEEAKGLAEAMLARMAIVASLNCMIFEILVCE